MLEAERPGGVTLALIELGTSFGLGLLSSFSLLVVFDQALGK